MLCFIFGAVSGTVYETMASKEVKRNRRVRTSDVVKQIDLNAVQREKLDVVLNTCRKRMIELNRSIRPEFSKIRQETRAEIRDILTSEQRAEFDELIAAKDRASRLRSEKKKKSTHSKE